MGDYVGRMEGGGVADIERGERRRARASLSASRLRDVVALFAFIIGPLCLLAWFGLNGYIFPRWHRVMNIVGGYGLVCLMFAPFVMFVMGPIVQPRAWEGAVLKIWILIAVIGVVECWELERLSRPLRPFLTGYRNDWCDFKLLEMAISSAAIYPFIGAVYVWAMRSERRGLTGRATALIYLFAVLTCVGDILGCWMAGNAYDGMFALCMESHR